jgi:hypothetical protein
MVIDNLLEAVMEAIVFLIEVLPALCSGLFVLLGPVFGLWAIGFIAITRGREPVTQTLTDKWVDEGLRRYWFTHHNQDTATKILATAAHLAVFLGIVLNIFTLIFMIWFGYQLLTGFPVIFGGLQENNPWAVP